MIKIFNNIKSNFHAFTHRGFLIFWLGQLVSLIGSWMQAISLPWLSLTLVNDTFLLSLVPAFQFLPMMILPLFSGAILDNHDKKRIIIICQIILAFFAFILSILVFMQIIRYWHLLIIAFLIGLTNAFDMPARQSFVIELTGKEDLMNAIALNSTVFNGARIIGPALAGFLIPLIGLQYCFFINAVSFIPVIIGLFFIKPVKINLDHNNSKNILINITDGLKYIFREKIIFWTLIAVNIVGIFGMNYSVLVPVFARDILNTGEKGYGFLMSIMGIGSLAGAIMITVLSKRGPKRLFLFITTLVSGTGFILLGLNADFILTAVLLTVIGFCNVSFFTTANTTLQLNAEHQYRGRVISLYTILFAGSTPLGSLYIGSIGKVFNIRIGSVACGAAIIICMIILLFINKIIMHKN